MTSENEKLIKYNLRSRKDYKMFRKMFITYCILDVLGIIS